MVTIDQRLMLGRARARSSLVAIDSNPARGPCGARGPCRRSSPPGRCLHPWRQSRCAGSRPRVAPSSAMPLRPRSKRSRGRYSGRRPSRGCAAASARRSSGIPGTGRAQRMMAAAHVALRGRGFSLRDGHLGSSLNRCQKICDYPRPAHRVTAAAAGSSRTKAPYSEISGATQAIHARCRTLSATKGLVARSWPKVDIGPWPGTKRVSSPIGHRRWVIRSSSCW